jgi:hypothetical protein
LPHPLDGSFYGVNSLLLGPAHVTNLLQKKEVDCQFFCSSVVAPVFLLHGIRLQLMHLHGRMKLVVYNLDGFQGFSSIA